MARASETGNRRGSCGSGQMGRATRKPNDATRVVLRGGRVIARWQDIDAPGDFGLADGKVESFAPAAGARYGDDVRVVDCGGLVVSPGFIDVHCHLREPGR